MNLNSTSNTKSTTSDINETAHSHSHNNGNHSHDGHNNQDSNANTIIKVPPSPSTNADPAAVNDVENTDLIGKTRETVQKVYRLLERTRTASTASSIDDDNELNDNFSRHGSGSGPSGVGNGRRDSRDQPGQQQQQRGRGGQSQYNANGGGARGSQNRRSRGSQSPGGNGSGAGSRSNSSSNRQSPSSEFNPDGGQEPETEEESQLAKLRCPSLSTEAVSEREQRRRKRMCSDYPGLAFGLGSGSVFGSDTMMKFSLIKNELHNVITGQLRRAENEVATFNRRIQLIEDDLEKSKVDLGSVTTELAEAVSSIAPAVAESEAKAAGTDGDVDIDDEELLDAEAKTQVKLIADQSNQVYNEAVRRLIIMEKELESLQKREEQSEMAILAELRRHELFRGAPALNCPNGSNNANANGSCDESQIDGQLEISQAPKQKLDHAVDLLAPGSEKVTEKLIAD